MTTDETDFAAVQRWKPECFTNTDYVYRYRCALCGKAFDHRQQKRMRDHELKCGNDRYDR